ncbi:MAG: histidine kinase, partial [Sediminibacterium sp.]|nr:histidine kinase [Sediminibacterium sp.]
MEKLTGFPGQYLPQTILDAFSSGIHVFTALRDKNDKIIDFELVMMSKNSAAFKGRTGVVGKKLLESLPEYVDLMDGFMEVMLTGVTKSYEKRQESDKGTGWFLVTDSKFGDGFINVWEDITEHKQAEEKIKELNRTLQINNRELASLNSELKTFNSIAATDYTDTLKKLYTNLEFIITNDAKNLSDEGKANVRRAQSAIQKMKLLTEDIVSYSSIHTKNNELQVVDLVAMLQSIKEDMTRVWPGIEIKIDCDDDMPAIQGYPFLLTVLFNHLIDNAIKFRKENSHPVIRIRCVEKDFLATGYPAAIPGTRYNHFSIEDDGIGFDHEHAEEIFTIFCRLHPKGTYKGSGIGLAICRKIM